MNILIHYRHFPIAMGRYFDMALRDLGHNVFGVGCYQGGKIPWGEQFNFPKYDFPPDYEIPEAESFPLDYVLDHIDFKPDVIIQAADVSYLSGKSKVPNVIIGTDPHCIDYTPFLENASHFFCMQNCYMEKYAFKNKYWLPYAYLPSVHYNTHQEPEYDVVFIGLQYEHRVRVLDELKARGHKVFAELGHIYDEYRDIYNKGKIAFNWSSKDDLPARFWEGMAMGRCVVTNHVPDLSSIDLLPHDDYEAFDNSVEGAISSIEYLLQDDNWKSYSERGEKSVKEHTYQNRCKEMLEIICR